MELSDADALKVAEPMMDDIILGISRRNYKLHSTHFSVSLKSVLDEEQFLADCDTREADWGLPGHRELVTILRKEKSFTLVWDQQHTRTEGQILAMTTIALKGGRYFVDYFLLH